MVYMYPDGVHCLIQQDDASCDIGGANSRHTTCGHP